MNLPAASCRVSKLILFYPLTLTLSPGRGNMGLTPQQAAGNYQVKRSGYEQDIALEKYNR